MNRPMLALAIASALAVPAAFAQKAAKQTQVKIQKTSISREDEIKLGKEAAAQIERELEVLKNAEVETWLNQIGQQLSKTPQANAYPYYFKLVNEDSINAFALPGGPMYVHTGLIKAAGTEGEVAGVLAHEMSHVALRHGAAQMGKQQTWGALFGALGAAAGALGSQNGQCGMLCQAGQIGAGVGGMAVLTKFSRGYERDSDLNGARMMAAAGYNPMDMARFFETLAKQSGSAGRPSGLEQWLSSHPDPGNRSQYVAQDTQFYPKRDYSAATGRFPRVKQAVASLPPPKLKPAALLAGKQGSGPRTNLPAGFKDLQAVGFAVAYPSTWQAGQAQQGGGSVYLVPQGGATQSQSGGLELLVGGMIDYFRPETGAAALDATTAELLRGLEKGDTNLRAERPGRIDLAGKPALLTRIATKTSVAREPEQTVLLYTVVRNEMLWHLVLAAPPSRWNELEPVFRQISQSVQFPD